MKKHFFGFTLVEVMVSITIVTILASVGLLGYNTVRDNAKKNAAQVELESIKLSFEIYLRDKGFLPSLTPDDSGDFCSMCTVLYGNNNYNTHKDWDTVLNRLQTEGYLDGVESKDPWGQSYFYDNNYKEECGDNVPPCKSVVCSAGADGEWNGTTNINLVVAWLSSGSPKPSGDDICVFLPGAAPS